MAKAKSLVSQKISVLKGEGKSTAQSVAEAISMGKAGRLRQGGVYVHKKSSRRSSRS